jgi:hypothetical protein
MSTETKPTPEPLPPARERLTESRKRSAHARRGRRIGWLLAALVCAAAAVIAIASSGTRHSTRSQSEKLFARTSVWNAPVSASAPIDPKSATYVAELERQLAHYGPWFNTTQYSVPVYTVGSRQSTVPVRLDPAANAPALAQAWRAVPLPANAKPASGIDASLVVRQPSTDKMWEFWQLKRDGRGWHARWGGYMASVSQNPGYYIGHTDWGSSATSLPAIAGLVRISELEAGHIDHALSLTLPETSSQVYSWPAERTDGNVASPDAIPEGTHLRLDPSLDIPKLHLPRFIRMLAEAAQRYGLIVHDRGGAVLMSGEDPSQYRTNPYFGADGFEGKSIIAVMQEFPWTHLQALRTTLHPVTP